MLAIGQRRRGAAGVRLEVTPEGEQSAGETSRNRRRLPLPDELRRRAVTLAARQRAFPAGEAAEARAGAGRGEAAAPSGADWRVQTMLLPDRECHCWASLRRIEAPPPGPSEETRRRD